ncbi:MAG: MtrB/PioB family decaheme-associated outer membrane protein [Rhodoferax sp.]
MIKTISLIQFQRTALALAVCAAFVPAQAQTSPAQTSISAGLGFTDTDGADRALYGQYSGLRKNSSVGASLGIDYSLRKDEPPTWVEFHGSELLGDTRELNLVWKRPGDWKISANYGELVRNDLNQVNTGLLNPGTTTPQVMALPGGVGSGTNFDLQTKRTQLGVGYTKIFSPRMQLAVDLKSENKKGSRLFGIGMNCPTAYDPACQGTNGIRAGWATLMLPEPVDANHSQIEARLSYALEKLRLSVGYYGSFYRNANTSINPTVTGNLYNAVGTPLSVSPGLLGYLQQPVALAPDNQSQQLDLSGNYAFTDKTRGAFKLAYSRASQDDGFSGTSRTGRTSLGGQVNTTLAQLGVTSRPTPKLSWLADVRYLDKDDQTPIDYYNIAGATPYTNHHLSNKKTNAKLQANWQFNSDYRGTLGADLELIDRGLFTPTSALGGVSALRQKTDETGVRAELRRRLSENLSGSISLSRSQRDGSNWLKDNSGLGVTEIANPADPALGLSTAIFMPTLADRQRDKIRLYADWMPHKDWALQFSAEGGKDKYSSPSSYGLNDTRMNQFGLDWAYAVSFRWALNGYLSTGKQSINQSRNAGYVMAFDNTNTSLGLGFSGKPTNQIELGGNLSFVDDTSKYDQTLNASSDPYSVASLAASGGLPDIVFRQTALKLFGKYALNKSSAVRVDFVHQQSKYNDWAWGYNGVPYTYSDGTTLAQKTDQTVNYIGISYTYQLP